MMHHLSVFATPVMSVKRATCVRSSIFPHVHRLAFRSCWPWCCPSNIPLDTDQQMVYPYFSTWHETLTAIPIEAGGRAYRLPCPTREMKPTCGTRVL
jgi:hypothetical protein